KDRVEEQNLLHQAMIASEDRKVSEARTALERAVHMDPDSFVALSQLGELELQADNPAEAVKHLSQARRLRPDDAILAFHEAQAREKTGDTNGAREALADSLKLDPIRFSARLLLGQIYLKLEDLRAAQDQFEAALLLQPGDDSAQLGLVRVQLASGNFLKAKE